MAIRLIGSVLTAVLPDADTGNREGPELIQTLGRTASGIAYVYDKSVQIDRMTLAWANLTQAERDDLEDFHLNDAEGALNTWTLRDTRRNLQWTARFLSRRLNFIEPTRDPTAASTGAHWSITFELEVSNEQTIPVS